MQPVPNSSTDPATGRPTGRTKVAAVVGDPVGHSLSPRLHNCAFTTLGLDWIYVAMPCRAAMGSGIVEAMRTLGIAGMSVTMPHKQVVAECADRTTEAVERLASANTLYWQDGEIWADSTDGDGLVAAYAARFGRTVSGLRVGVLGGGGAARSIVEALGRNQVGEILVANRTEASAISAASMAPMARVAEPDEFADVEVIINATSVGMSGGDAPDRTPLDTSLLRPEHHVCDIVYEPRTTPLLAAAAEVGAEACDGVPMLLHQAALQFERWTNTPAPLESMEAAVFGS